MKSQLRAFVDDYARSLQTASCFNCCDTALSPKAELLSTDMTVASRQEALSGSENVWIFKPPHSGKGQGIQVRCGLKKILTEAEKRNWYCVVQKYLAQPLLLPNCIDGALAKVDLRLWIVVISWNPLICFAHPDVYARIATRPFVIDPDAKLETEAHVTNIRDEDNRVDTKTFMSMLGERRSALFKSRSWPLMLDAVRAALFASRASVIHEGEVYRAAHPNSPSGPTAFELVGLDFGIDNDMRPWLYEANISPNMLGRCEFLRAWAEESMESLLSIVLAFHEGKLVLPTSSELDAMPGQDCLERLFPPGVVPRGRHTDACYGQEVSNTQPALVAGLDLGPESPCGKWLLVVKERTKNAMVYPPRTLEMAVGCQIPSSRLSRREGRTSSYSRILCEVLQTNTGTLQTNTGTLQTNQTNQTKPTKSTNHKLEVRSRSVEPPILKPSSSCRELGNPESDPPLDAPARSSGTANLIRSSSAGTLRVLPRSRSSSLPRRLPPLAPGESGRIMAAVAGLDDLQDELLSKLGKKTGYPKNPAYPNSLPPKIPKR